MDVVIVGGGIGGLTLGLALQRAGIAVPDLRGGASDHPYWRRDQCAAARDA